MKQLRILPVTCTICGGGHYASTCGGEGPRRSKAVNR